MRKLAVLFLAACGGGGGSETRPNQLPVANLAAGESVVAGQALVFDGSSSADPDGDSLRFSWSFGDGGRGGAAKQAHVFAEAGSFTVNLTVSDGRGGVDGATHTVTVTAAPPPTAMVSATVRVSSPTGERIAGATVRVRGGAEATTDGGGLATVTIGAGATQVLRVERAGFAPQTQVLDLPEADPFIEVVVYPLAPMLALDDASAGGVVSGTDGARVELPPDALVDDSGAPVSGAVDVSMTPLDVVTAGAAFPGKFEGIDASGAAGMLLSWGTVAYSFSQEGRALNLAADRTATVDLPVYAGLNLDGSTVAAGDVFPLWSLDEATGVWIQEGEGTVVAAPGSPTGLVLRGEVGHFSWWNVDKFGPSHNTDTKCCIDGNYDGECDGDTICYVRGRTDCPSAYCNMAKPSDNPPPPAYSASAVIGAGATLRLGMPADFPVFLEGFGQNGLQYGYTVVWGTTDAATILLHPVETPLPTQMITLPWNMAYSSGAPGSFARYTFDAEVDAPLLVSVRATEGSSLAGIVTLRAPDGEALRAANFDAAAGGFSLRLPDAGRYTLEVNPHSGEPGGYTLEAELVTGGLVITGRSPAPDAIGVATTTPVVVTFSDDVKFVYSFPVQGPDGAMVPGTFATEGSVVTFTPTAPLAPGVAYRVTIPTDVQSTGGVHLAVEEQWTFYTAEAVGVPALLGGGYYVEGAAAGDESFFVVTQLPGMLGAYRYVAGAGWGMPVALDTAFAIDPVVAAAGAGLAMAVWTLRVGEMYSLYASRHTPASGWSEAEPLVVDLAAKPREYHVAIDAQGRALVTWTTTVTGALVARRWDGTWGSAVTLAPNAYYQHKLGTNAAGLAAAELQIDGKLAVARFDGSAWSAPEDLGASYSTAFFDGIALDDAGNIFVAYGDPYAGHVRRRDAGDGTWGTPHTIGTSCRGLAVSPGGTAMVSHCNYTYFGGSESIRVDYWNGVAWEAPQSLQANHASSLMFHVRATATDRFVLFWHESTYGVTFTRYRTLENGALGTTDETTLFNSNLHTAFLVSPQNKVSIVGPRLSMNGMWAMRIR